MNYGETYFRLYRKIFSNGLWKNPLELRLFLWILGQAVYDEEGVKYGTIKVNRGQYLRSYRKLQEDLTYVENRQIKIYPLTSIKRAIDKLVDFQNIAICETELGTLFTILNYDKYQAKQSKNKDFTHFENNEINELGTELGTTCVQPANNTNKVYKDNNNIYAQKFNEFWSIYPKKVSKKKTEITFLKLKPNEELFNKIITAVKLQIQSEQWTKNNGQFIPHPTTWLNQERWNDEITSSNQNIYSVSFFNGDENSYTQRMLKNQLEVTNE